MSRVDTNCTDGAVVVMVVVGVIPTTPAVPDMAELALGEELPTDRPTEFPPVEEFLTLPPPHQTLKESLLAWGLPKEWVQHLLLKLGNWLIQQKISR